MVYPRFRHIAVSVLLLLVPLSAAQASPIDVAVSREKAAGRMAVRQKRDAVSLRLVGETAATRLFTHGRQFVLAAADDRLPDVLAYGTFADTSSVIPTALNDVLRAYDRRLAGMNVAVPARKAGCAEVAPLLTSVRHQEAPYNGACPYYFNTTDSTWSEERCQVGCVATALEQILTYYRRTYVLRDTLKGWTTPHYQIPDVLPGNSVDTRLIQDRYTGNEPAEALEAVARLGYWLGQATHMSWGLGESGTNTYRAVEPLRRVFGLGYVRMLDSYYYEPEAWVSAIRQELMSGRPVYCSGYTTRLSGHAFVLDGQDADGLFHVNWGYGGNYDGYFDLAVLYAAEPAYDTTAEGREEGFSCNQEVLFLHPDSLDVELPDTLERRSGDICVDSLCWDDEPEANVLTRVRLFLRNTTAQALTTPMEFFTNLPADTDTLAQADFVGLTGVTLQPLERREMSCVMQFARPGDRLLRYVVDGERIFELGAVKVAQRRQPQLTLSEPQVDFPEAGTARVCVCADNAASGGRVGQNLICELLAASSDATEGTRHVHKLFLSSGEARTDTTLFRGLEAGETYELLVRSPWMVQHRLTFTLPDLTGIAAPDAPKPADIWRTLDGRMVSRPSAPGIYLRGQRKMLVR